MKAGVVIVSIFLVCVLGAVVVDAGALGALCGVLSSTTAIAGRLCHGDGGNIVNQTIIDGFFGCYDNVPGKSQFIECQTSAFGGALDNPNTIETSCGNQLKLPGYFICLRREFSSAGLDLLSTVEKLNACQSEALGVK